MKKKRKRVSVLFINKNKQKQNIQSISSSLASVISFIPVILLRENKTLFSYSEIDNPWIIQL